jgi:hypothetical protein
MAIIFLRTATNSVQSSIYVVYLKGIGLTGTSIGILFAAIEITSGLGSLFAGRAMRLGDPQRTMLSGTVLCAPVTLITRRARTAANQAEPTRATDLSIPP